VLTGHVQAVRPVEGDVGGEPFGLEPRTEPAGQRPLVLHDQYPHDTLLESVSHLPAFA
jgi:hypothetical protein